MNIHPYYGGNILELEASLKNNLANHAMAIAFVSDDAARGALPTFDKGGINGVVKLVDGHIDDRPTVRGELLAVSDEVAFPAGDHGAQHLHLCKHLVHTPIHNTKTYAIADHMPFYLLVEKYLRCSAHEEMK